MEEYKKISIVVDFKTILLKNDYLACQITISVIKCDVKNLIQGNREFISGSTKLPRQEEPLKPGDYMHACRLWRIQIVCFF